MNAYLFGPVTSMIEEVMSHLVADGHDYAQNLVVFPGKRPAHMLRAMIARERGGAYLPPRILSADQFIDFLYQDLADGKMKEINALDAAGILLDLQETLSRILVDDRNRKLESFLPFAIKAFQELEELKIANVAAGQLTIRLNSFLDDYDVKELLYLRDFYPAFYDEVQKRGLITRAMKYAAVAANASSISFKRWGRVVIAGYIAPNSSESTLFHALQGLEQVRFLFQLAAGTDMPTAFIETFRPERKAEDSVRTQEVQFYEAPDGHGQMFRLAALLKEWKDKGIQLDERTVIVVPNPERLFPMLAYGISEIDEHQRNVSLGFPLTRTPVYGFLTVLLNTLTTEKGGRYFAPAYLELLLHPYTKNILFGKRTDVTRILLHTLEEEFFKDSSVMYANLEDILANDEVMDSAVRRLGYLDITVSAAELKQHLIELHANLLDRPAAADSISAMSFALVTTLRYINTKSTAARHPYFMPFVKAIIHELEILKDSGIAHHSFDNIGSYERLIKRALTGTIHPFPGTPVHGMQILGLLETRQLKFDRVVIVDATDDILPGGRGTDMLLPQRIRNEFKLSTNKTREGLEEQYFHCLCQGASEVHIFYQNGSGIERSRFVEQLLWDIQKKRGSTDEEELVHTIQYQVNLQNPVPVAIEKTADIVESISHKRLSPSALDTYLSCPRKFYFRYVLGLRPPRTVSGDIEQQEIGSAVHSILQKYFEPFIGKNLSISSLDTKRMDKTVTSWFEETYHGQVNGEIALVQIQVQRRMRDFLEGYQKSIVREAEVNIIGLEEQVESIIDGIKFRGYIDRIEKRDDAHYILDYKTGGALPSIKLKRLETGDRETWSNSIGSLQLPMYVRMYAESSGISPEQIVPLYLHLGKNTVKDIEEGIGSSKETIANWYDRLNEVIEGLVKELLDVDQPFSPPANLAKSCAWCDYKTLCGTRWLENFL